jgi:hypothetical protein
MTRARRFLSIIAIITATELAGWLVIRTGMLVWHEAHRPAGLPWMATIALVGAVATVVVWGIVLLGGIPRS